MIYIIFPIFDAFFLVGKMQQDYPKWLGNNEFHKSHRMNLLRKDYDYYSEHFDEVATTYEIESYPYYWPDGEK